MINLSRISPMLPSGIIDSHSELFFVQNQPKLLRGGQVMDYQDFPQALLKCVDDEMQRRPKALQVLRLLKIDNPDQMRMAWMKCNLGGFDNVPDFNPEFTQIQTEYVPCNLRGLCPYEGIFCQGITVENGTLTIRQLRIMALIRIGLYDKEIAEMLFISVDTLKSHKRAIQLKLGVERKAAIANEASFRGIC